MLQLLPQTDALAVVGVNPAETVDYINSYIEKHSCKKMSVDISFMNILDACYVSTLCSTKHYIKYPDGQIKWKISSKEVQEYGRDLDLGNTSYEVC